MDRLTGTGVGRATTVQDRRDMLPANLPSKEQSILFLSLKFLPIKFRQKLHFLQLHFQLHNTSLGKTICSCEIAFPVAHLHSIRALQKTICSCKIAFPVAHLHSIRALQKIWGLNSQTPNIILAQNMIGCQFLCQSVGVHSSP